MRIYECYDVLATHSKFYYFDTGVFQANRPKGPLDKTEEIEGFALEGLIAQHLKAWCGYTSGNHLLYYWQTRSKVEVDFIVYGESGMFAIEVKNSEKVRPEDLRALTTFGKDYPEALKILLYRGNKRFVRNDIKCIPCDEFLKNLKPEQFPD